MPTESNATGQPFPVALVGLACRFPGAADVADFWSLLKAGTDAVGEIPNDRWDVDAYYHPDPAAPGKMYTRAGGFIADIDKFDAGFFRDFATRSSADRPAAAPPFRADLGGAGECRHPSPANRRIAGRSICRNLAVRLRRSAARRAEPSGPLRHVRQRTQQCSESNILCLRLTWSEFRCRYRLLVIAGCCT